MTDSEKLTEAHRLIAKLEAQVDELSVRVSELGDELEDVSLRLLEAEEELEHVGAIESDV